MAMNFCLYLVWSDSNLVYAMSYFLTFSLLILLEIDKIYYFGTVKYGTPHHVNEAAWSLYLSLVGLNMS